MRLANGKCEGRKSLSETNSEAVALAKALSRKRPKGGQLSLRDGPPSFAYNFERRKAAASFTSYRRSRTSSPATLTPPVASPTSDKPVARDAS